MAQSTQFAGAGSGWTNSGNITAFDSSFATAPASRTFVIDEPSAPGHYVAVSTPDLVASSFAHSIGASDTVSGIEVEIRPAYIGGSFSTLNGTCTLRRAGVQIGNAKTFTFAGTESVVLLGSGSDLWGGSWTGAQLAQLQVVFFARPSTGSGDTTVYVNGVRTVANYTTDTTPFSFAFTDITGATLSTVYTSNEITVDGMGVGASTGVTISGSTGYAYMKNNSGVWTTVAGTAVNGDKFRVRVTSSGTANTAVSVVLNVGGTADTYTVTTAAVDTTPAAFGWSSSYGVEPAATITSSNAVFVSGINSASAITIAGASGTYSKNGGAYTSAAGTVNNGDYIYVRLTSATYSGNATTSVTIGGVVGTFTAYTRAVDTTPAAFSFVDVPSSLTNTVNESNEITISGIEAAANVTFAFAGNGSVQEYRIYSGGAYGAWTAIGATTIANGNKIQVRFTSSAVATQTGSLTVTIGGVSDTYSVSTTVDTVPTQFTFVDKTNAVAGVSYDSAAITIAGMTPGIPVTAQSNGGEFNVNAGAFTTVTAVQNGDSIIARGTAPLIPGSTQSVVFTLGGISDTFGITTRAAVAQDF